MKDCKDPSLSSKLDETWKKAYDEGRSHLLDGILYHRAKHTWVMALKDRTPINTLLHEYNYSVADGHLSEERRLERVKTFSWWPNWNKDVAEYCKTCDRCQKANRATAYHPQTDGLEERMIQKLEDMIIRFCAYGLEFKDSDGFTHDWCTLIQALELAYKKSIHYSTGKTQSMLEKIWNQKLPYDTLKKDLVDIHPTASSFKLMLEKSRNQANRCMQDSFKYEKERWYKSHKPPDFKIGDLVLVSTINFNHIKGPKKLKDSFAGPFMVKAIHGPKAVQLELTGELMNKNPAFPVILIKPYSLSDKKYPL
ncbi:hypothetical protein O181_100162 [Austropuccinia psidii MF-1]|uniref:Integrase zinc-binding domain-containing protein n=1 Tax=Austropuccinia psidii MF-1 TaxID=1389203 RepID=A0A9Q3JEP4_9BASI|nr:hypothetical protein [Austropuccinia psidii MF-1]